MRLKKFLVILFIYVVPNDIECYNKHIFDQCAFLLCFQFKWSIVNFEKLINDVMFSGVAECYNIIKLKEVFENLLHLV